MPDAPSRRGSDNDSSAPGSTAPAATSPTTLYDAPWLDSLLRPLLMVGMTMCIDGVVLIFLHIFLPALTPAVTWAILALALLAAAVGVVSTSWLAHPKQRLRRTWGYRAAEILLIVLAARGVLWLAQGRLPSAEMFLNRPSDVFFDGLFVVVGFVVLCTWFIAIDFTDDLNQLALRADELHVISAGRRTGQDTSQTGGSDRRSVLNRFVTRWIGWGVLLVILAALMRMGVTPTTWWKLTRAEIDPTVIVLIISYFLAGLVLISQGQLAVLRAGWALQRLPISAGVQRNWPLYTLAALIVFGLLAALLPLGDTSLLATVIGAGLNLLVAVVTVIFQVLSLLLLLLLSLLPFSGQTIPPPPMERAAAPAAAPPLLEIPPWLGGVFFWSSMLLILSLAAYFYFSDRQAGLGWLQRLLGLLWLRWTQWWSGMRAWSASRIGGRTDAFSREPGASPNVRRRWPLPWRQLSQEEQVRRLYFEMLAQAEEHDLPRRQSETPAGYAPRLEEEAMAAAEERAAIEQLTAAFQAVRYAGHTTGAEQLASLRTAWAKLRRFFKSKAMG